MKTTIHKHGRLHGEKIQYPDGIGCCVWYPLGNDEDDDQGSGLCFDFSASDLDDFILLLQDLRDATADVYEDD